MRLFPLHHSRASKFLLAFRALAITGRSVFDYALEQTFYETAAPALMILIEQRIAGGTVNGNGADIFTRHLSSFL
ncbi:MAG: hypothetical protein ACI906_005410 [Candidatus Latescibacterota bacterium]|jgi:hypothetical protein